MAVTNYFTVDGQMYGEETGGTFRGYIPDALGSVMATTTSGTSAENTYRYKPYGGLLAKTGVGADPKFSWVGGLGYREGISVKYIRSRHYSSILASWIEGDPLWPSERAYSYAESSPITLVDPFGRAACMAECCCQVKLLFISVNEKWQQGNKAGLKFTVTIGMQNRLIEPGDKKGTCTMTWFEKNYYKFDKGEGTTPWHDVCDEPGGCPFDPFSPPTECPSEYKAWTETDLPSLSWGAGSNWTYKLCIKITVTDGCTGTPYVLRKWMKLKVKNGKLESIEPPPDPLQEMEDFCK